MPDHAPAIRGLAVAALTLACVMHAAWRRGGIIVNNVLAFIKILTLIAIICLGFAAAAGASFGRGPVGKTATSYNFDGHRSFSKPSTSLANYSGSILFIVYSYSGFKQPFYVSKICILLARPLLVDFYGTGTQRGLGTKEEVCQSDDWYYGVRWCLVRFGECCICKSTNLAGKKWA